MNLLPIAAAPGFFRNLDAAKWGDIGQATLDTLLMLAGALPLTLLIRRRWAWRCSCAGRRNCAAGRCCTARWPQ